MQATPKLNDGFSTADKQRLAKKWYADGKTKKHIASLLCVSPQYVGKLLNEKQNINAALEDDEKEDGLDLNAAYLKARTEYTKTQNIKLQRELSLKAGDLITREHLEEVLRAVIRRYETFADWLRKHQPGNEEALESFTACPKAALKECKQRGWLEGEGIDEIKHGGLDDE